MEVTPPPNLQRTLVMLKPDCFQRGLCGEVISRFERKGLKLKAMKLVFFQRHLAQQHYREHADKHFYERLVDFMLSGPVVLMVIEGVEALLVVRKMLGSTHGWESQPGTIRGDFCLEPGVSNLVHASDSPEAARREINLHFRVEELLP